MLDAFLYEFVICFDGGLLGAASVCIYRGEGKGK